MSTIHITVNGTTHTIASGTTLATLIKTLRPEQDQNTSPLASAVNGRHIARGERAACVLNDHDTVTTFEPISGG